MEIKVVKNILEANDAIASQNRELFDQKNIYVVNIMGSPGAGKTTLLQKTVDYLKKGNNVGVIEGDIATSHDAELIASHGIPVVQINTGGACHLDGNMIRGALKEFDLGRLNIIIVENVGNLVCPAEFNIGEDNKAMIISVTEGDDKPLKYPLMFQVSSVLLLNKIDLIPYTNFNMEKFKDDAYKVNPGLQILELSCTTDKGLDEWFTWLDGRTVKKVK